VNNVEGSTTNLHTHGLHVSGDGNADDITRFVEYGNQLHFVWDLRTMNHQGGTFWYHAHQHLHTHDQVNFGALGMLIVNDDFDTLLPPNLTNANRIKRFLSNEQHVFLHYVAQNTIFGNWYTNGEQVEMYGNTKPKPQLTIVDGEWTRFRIAVAHADATRLDVKIVGDACVFHILANDGVYLNEVPSPEVPVATVTSASRLDLAVRCVSPGATADLEIASRHVATITVVDGTPIDAVPFEQGQIPWSPSRPYYLQDLRDEEILDSEHKLSVTLTSDTVNGKPWDVTTPLVNIAYDEVQEWTVMDSGVHPLHMHLYHFQIADPEGCGHHEYGEWYDTGEWSVASDYDLLDLPALLKLTPLSLSLSKVSAPGPCKIRFKTADIGGKMVFHCHIIQHSDMGSMAWAHVIGGPTHPDQNPGVAQEPIDTNTQRTRKLRGKVDAVVTV
jgi:FtsP/CotA-like multicopper oxidase with cupredoxin domain